MARSYCLRIVLLALALLAAPKVALAQSDAEHQQFLFAYRLLQRGDVEEAATEFDDYIGAFPEGEKLGDAQYYRALLYRQAGNNEQAAATLTDNARPTLVPAYAVDLLRGQVLSDLGRFRDALASLERIDVSELEPNVAVSALYLKGLAYRGAENLPAAATALSDAAELETAMRPRVCLDLAKVYALMEQPENAIGALDRAIALNDASVTPEAARFAGDLSYNAGVYAAAIGYYNTVVTRHQASEHFAPAVVGLLWAQFADGRHEDLLRTFEDALPTLPTSDRMPAYYLAGSASQEMGNHERAAELFSQVAGGDGRLPIQEKILYKLAISRFELGEYAAMNTAATRLLQLFPRTELRVDVAFLQATAQAQQGQVQAGANRLSEFIDRGPSSPYYQQALLRRAHLYETHDLNEPAAHDYRAYLDSVEQPTPIAIQASFRLMELHGTLDQFDQVIALATGVLQIQDDTLRTPEVEQEALYRLAVAYRITSDLDRALSTHSRLTREHPANPYRAESLLEQGLIYMAQDDPGRGVPMLMDSIDEEGLTEGSRISAMRIVAQYDIDNGNAARAMELRLAMQQLAGPAVFNDNERLWMGARMIEAGEARQALAYLEPIADEALRDRAMLLTGRAQRIAGDLEAAEETLREVSAVSERYDVDAMLEIALVFRDGGQLNQALAELAALRDARRGHRIASQALFETGRIHRRLMDNARRASDQQAAASHAAQALESFKRLWVMYPDREGEDLAQRAYIELAELQAVTGDAEGEIETLDELAEAHPDTAYASYALGVLAARAGQNERADDFLRQAVRQAQGNAELSERANRLLRRER